jgi:hypothetical protein
MSRSSHRGLVQPPAELLSRAWKEVRVDFLETDIESVLEDCQFVARTDALNALTDHAKHADEFDRRMRELLVSVDSFITVLQEANQQDPDAGLAIELKYKTIAPVRARQCPVHELPPSVAQDVARIGELWESEIHFHSLPAVDSAPTSTPASADQHETP